MLTCITSLRTIHPMWCLTAVQQNSNFIIAAVSVAKAPLHTSAHSPGHSLRIKLFLSPFAFLLLTDSLDPTNNRNSKIHIYPKPKWANEADFNLPITHWQWMRRYTQGISRCFKRFSQKQFPPTRKSHSALVNTLILWALIALGTAMPTIKVGGILSLCPCLKITFLNIVINKTG